MQFFFASFAASLLRRDLKPEALSHAATAATTFLAASVRSVAVCSVGSWDWASARIFFLALSDVGAFEPHDHRDSEAYLAASLYQGLGD